MIFSLRNNYVPAVSCWRTHQILVKNGTDAYSVMVEETPQPIAPKINSASYNTTSGCMDVEIEPMEDGTSFIHFLLVTFFLLTFEPKIFGKPGNFTATFSLKLQKSSNIPYICYGECV